MHGVRMYRVKLKVGQCLPVWTAGLGHTFQRLIYSSATRAEADHTDLDPDTFGQLAAQSGGKESLDKNKSAKKKRQTQFPKLQYSQVEIEPHSQVENFDAAEIGVEARAVQSKSTVEKWRQFRDEEYLETLRFLQGFQDDSEDDYNHQIHRTVNGKNLETFDKKKPDTKDGTQQAGDMHSSSLTQAEKKDISDGMQGSNVNSNFNFGTKSEKESSKFASDCASGTQSSQNPDSFGTIKPHRVTHEAEEGDEGDRREEQFEAARQARKHRPQWYGQRMKKLCRERRLAEALHILEVEMPSVRARPNEFCYNVLINACGRAGYTKKAFQLYNKMKQRKMEVQDMVYTGLFMACAHSPWATTDGLDRATHLRQQLIEKAYPVNQITSHAMIKAFGRCGDIKTAFQIVDEMVGSGLVVTTETMNFLLQACITDTTTGFRHAIMVWRKMRELKLLPDIYSYNLLIRCTAECQTGDPRLTSQLLNPPCQHKKQKRLSPPKKTITEKVLLLDMDDKTGGADDTQIDAERSIEKFDMLDSVNSQTTGHRQSTNQNYVNLQNTQDNFSLQSSSHKINSNENDLEIVHDMSTSQHTRHKGSMDHNDLSPQERCFVEEEVRQEGNGVLPSILGHKVTTGSVVALGALDTPQDRLALLGGPSGLVEQMRRDRVRPDLKTVTQLLTSLPSDTHAEEALLQSMNAIGLEPDTQFCNMVIRKRCMRGDLQAAKAVMDVMQDHHLLPDIVTFGCLALGCHNLHDARQLLSDMDSANFRANLEIMGALTRNGMVGGNFLYTLEMLHEMRRRDLTPNTQLLDTLEQARVKAKKLLLRRERGGKVPKWKVDGARVFLLEYKTWLKASEVQLPDHPWAQYRTEPGTSVVGEA